MYTITAHKPDRSALLSTLIITLLFCLPFCGSVELFLFLGVGQLLFTWSVLARLQLEPLAFLWMIRRSNPGFFFLLLGWLISTTVSLLLRLASDETNSFEEMAALLRHGYLLLEVSYCFALIILLRLTDLSAEALFAALVTGAVMMTGVHLLAFNLGPEPDSWQWFFNPPLAGHIRDMGNIIAASIVVCGVFLLYSAQQKFILSAVLTALCSYLLWSGGRTAIVATLLVCLIMIYLYRKYTPSRLRLNILLVLTAWFVAYLIAEQLMVFDWNGLGRTADTLISLPQVGDKHMSLNGVMTGRMAMWELSLQNLDGHWLFGLGPYSYFFMPGRIYGDQPHNLLVQMLLEWGVVGTLLTLSLMMTIAVDVVKRLRNALEFQQVGYLCALAVVMVLTLIALTSGTYFNYQPVFIVTTAYAVLLGYRFQGQIKTAA